MRKCCFVCVLAVCLISSVAARAAEPDAQLLSQVQAADVLSDLLTFTADRLSARAVGMGNYLKQINQLDAFDQFKPATATPGKIDYTQLFSGAVNFVKNGGDKYSDPSLAKLSDAQLRNELTALQTYDVREFAFLNQKRQITERVKSFLISINEFDGYRKYAGDLAPSPTTSTTSSLTAQQQVAHVENLVKAARAAAWARAKAKGVSQSDFDAQWAAKENQFKTQVSQRVQAMGALSASIAASTTASSAPQPDSPAGGLSGVQINTPQQPAGTELTPFADPYSDTFHTNYNGPGVYHDYDTRIDTDNDQRVNGEYDRRGGLNFDRRENIQIDVRQGV
jgi:hypothetical protein